MMEASASAIGRSDKYSGSPSCTRRPTLGIARWAAAPPTATETDQLSQIDIENAVHGQVCVVVK